MGKSYAAHLACGNAATGVIFSEERAIRKLPVWQRDSLRIETRLRIPLLVKQA
jgi:hypothetical protein